MALSTVTVTFDAAQILGTDFDSRRTRVRVYTNVENQTLIDTAANLIRMGDETVSIAADGTGSFTTWAPGADGNPISWQTYVAFDYPRTGARDRVTRTFGPYTITANTDLADLEEEQAVPAEYLTAVTDALDAIVDTAQGFAAAASSSADAAAASALEAAAIIVTDLGTTDAQMTFLIENPSDAQDALDAAYRAPAELAEKRGDAWWAEAFAAPAADDVPTLTISTTSGVSGGVAITPSTDYTGDAHFQYDGTPSVQIDTGTKIKAATSTKGVSYYFAASTVLSSMSSFAAQFDTTSAGSPLVFRVSVNGKWASIYATAFTGLTASTTYFLRISFPTARPRRVRIEAVSAANFGGVVVPTGGTATRPAAEIVKRMVSVGDSYDAGANGTTTSNPTTNGTTRIETASRYVAKALQCDSYINMSVGGTAWVYDGGGGKSTFGQRVPEILAANPQVVFLAGSINDVSLTPSAATFDQVYAAVTSVLAQLVNIPVVILTGPQRDTTISANYAIYDEAVRRAASAYNRIFVDTLDTIKGGLYNAADAVHGSAAAHYEVLAPKIYDGLDRAAIDQIIAAAIGGRASTDLTLTVSPASAAATGATVTLTATQSAIRTGVVDFQDAGVLIGTGTVSGGGVATFATTALANGSHSLLGVFRPAAPGLVKPATSNAVAYTISANLGFTDNFTRANGAPGATLNGKTYTTFGGNGAWAIASNKLANPTNTSGSTYLVADAGTPNGTLQFTIGGSGGTGLGVLIPLRVINGTYLLRITRASSEIVIQKVINNSSTQFPGAISTGSSIWVTGDVMTIAFPTPTTMTVKKNGVNVPGLVGITISDTDTIAAGIDTATLFGVGVTGSSGAATTFDDLSFVP